MDSLSVVQNRQNCCLWCWKSSRIVNSLLIIIFLLSGCKDSNHNSYQGYIEADNIFISSPNGGILRKLAVTEGKIVQKGELLFELDPKPQSIEVKQFEEELKQAQHSLKDLLNPKRDPEIQAIQAQIEQTNSQIDLGLLRVNRYTELSKKQAIAKDTLDEALANLARLKKQKAEYEANLKLARLGSREEQISAQENQIKIISAKLDLAKWQLEQKKQLAPASGIIFDTYFVEGEYVASQRPIVSILTHENTYIEFFVPLMELNNLKLDQTVSFILDGDTKLYKARISYISPEAEYIPPLVYSYENRVNLVFRVRAEIAEPDKVKTGQPVMVQL